MSSVVKEVRQLYDETARNKKVIIEESINGDAVVFADQNMIHTVLRNLVSNALKFTPSNGKITVAAESTDRMLEVSVTDTGVGIPENVQKKLFKIDENVTSLGTQDEKGTGLGLILCKDLVTKNGGQISLQSTVGEGTTFKFTIPLIHKKINPAASD